MHRIHPDTVARELHCRGLGRQAHRALRRVVAHMHEALAGEAGDRRDIHDRSAAGFLHFGNHRTHAEEHAARVDVHLLVPSGRVEDVRVAAADAGIVDQHVDPAPRRHRFDNKGVPVGLAGHVEFLKSRRAAVRLDRTRELGALSLKDIRQHDFGALGREKLRRRGPHTGRRPRHDRNLVLQTHRLSSRKFGWPLGWWIQSNIWHPYDRGSAV